MRILILDTCYPQFLERLYRDRPELESRPYEEQWRSLMEQAFGTADAYSHFLRGLGHEAAEVVLNCEPLQLAWAADHGYPTRKTRRRLTRQTWRHAVVEAQVEHFAPDVVYVQDLHALPGATLARLARGRLLVGQIASEPPPAEALARFDLVLTSFPHFVERFRERGVPSEYFPIGFDPRVLDRLDPPPSRAGVVFVGTLSRDQHMRGNGVLERAARQAPIDFWGRGAETLPEESAIRRRYRGEAWGLEMYGVLASARIAVNRHIDLAEDYANNMRLYEATGVGTLLLTDAKRNLSELFEPDREVVTYADADELVRQVRYFLAHEDERLRIARAGQARTLSQHNYERRMQELVEILTRYLP